jgi:WD domain, G-beta repeat
MTPQALDSSKGEWSHESVFDGFDNGVGSLAFSHNGRHISVAALGYGGFKITDAASGEGRRAFGDERGLSWLIKYSPDGSQVATASHGSVMLWSSATETLLQTLNCQKACLAAAFSRNGRQLAAALGDGSIKLWDLATGSLLMTLQNGSSERVYMDHNSAPAVAFSPDGSQLALARMKPWVEIWNPATGVLLRKLLLQGNSMTCSVAYSPDGSQLAASSDYDGVEIWNPATGEQLRTLRCEGFSRTVAYSPDGDRLASGSRDAVLVWNPTTGVLLQTLSCSECVKTVAFSRDGSQLAVGTSEGLVQLWKREKIDPEPRQMHSLPARAVFRGLFRGQKNKTRQADREQQHIETMRRIEALRDEVGRVKLSPADMDRQQYDGLSLPQVLVAFLNQFRPRGSSLEAGDRRKLQEILAFRHSLIPEEEQRERELIIALSADLNSRFEKEEGQRRAERQEMERWGRRCEEELQERVRRERERRERERAEGAPRTGE